VVEAPPADARASPCKSASTGPGRPRAERDTSRRRRVCCAPTCAHLAKPLEVDVAHQESRRPKPRRSRRRGPCRRITRVEIGCEVDHVGLGAEALAELAQPVAVRLLGLPTTIRTSTPGASTLTASCRFCVA
jgi:hypothetical protein